MTPEDWEVIDQTGPRTNIHDGWEAFYPDGDPTVSPSGVPYHLCSDETTVRAFLAEHPGGVLRVLRSITVTSTITYGVPS